MTQAAIRIENISKIYRIGLAKDGERSDTLREAIRSRFCWKNPTGATSGVEDFYAIKDVSLTVPAGEVLGVIGCNGAGKSTLLKILSRITEPSTGRITINGRVASLLEVGTGFHPELTGRENIFLNGAILGMSRKEIKRKFDEIVAFAGVEQFLETPVKRYSSGMYVRLAFAVAAHLDPEILIIDEVLAVGDIEFQNRCLGKMQNVAQSGRTVLFVSHQLNAVRQLCTSCCLMREGQIVSKGATADVLKAYLDTASSTSLSNSTAVRVFEQPQPIEFLEGQILDYHERPNRHNPFGEPWSVKAEFKLLHDIPDLVAALGIRSNSGQSIQTCWSNPINAQKGIYRVTFCQDQVHLEANSYNLVLGFSRKTRPILQMDLGNFDILHDRYSNAGGFVACTSGVGMVLNSMSTEFTRLDKA